MPKKKKKVIGPPSKYDASYCQLLIDHMDSGLSFDAFKGVVGVCRATLYNWADLYPEFKEAKDIAEGKALLYWEKVGRDGLYNETIKSDDGTTVTRSINATIWIFTMKNRFGWRDKHDIDTEVKVSQSEEVKELLAWLKSVREVA